MSTYVERLKNLKYGPGSTPTKPTKGAFVSSVSSDRGPYTEIFGFSLDELREAAGEDWQTLESDPDGVAAFAQALQARRMRKRGEIPKHYTAMTTCRGCGPVPIFSGAPESVEGCPWCLNRVQGQPVPQPPERPARRLMGHTVAGAEVVEEPREHQS